MATVTTISTFPGAPGPEGGELPVNPSGNMVVASSGNLFGTTQTSPNGDGTIFEVANSANGYASTPTTLDTFPSGDTPGGGLIADAAGNLYGVAGGGADGDGEIFEIANNAGAYASTPTVLASFDGSDGVGPTGSLVMDSAGDLFGLTAGSNNTTIFELAKTASGYASTPTTLAQFNAPYIPGPLVVDSAGDLFAPSIAKSGPSTGSVIEIAHTASGYSSTPTTLATFGSADGTPSGALVADAAGNLFGVTDGGGAKSSGEIYEIAKTAGGYASTPTVLASFPQENDHSGSLMIDGADNLFVQALPSGGPSGGELYELPKTDGIYAGTLTALAQLPFSTNTGLTGGAAGDIFGATDGFGQLGGYTNSTIYEASGTGYVPTSASTGETLGANDTAGQHLTGTPLNDTFYAGHNSVVMTGDGGANTFVFNALPWNAGSITDFNTATDKLDLSGIFNSIGYHGSNPVADGYLAFQSDGNGNTQVLVNSHSASDPWPTLITTLDGVSPASITPADYGYGSSSGGGTGGGTGGSASISVVSTFSGNPEPNGTLLADSAGDLFGTTQGGGANNDGTVFEIAHTASGYASAPTTLASFDGADGSLAEGGLIADAAGNLYGVAARGGANGDGTIVELAKTSYGYASTPTVLASFDGSNGVGPTNQLVMDAAGDLFGVAETGGTNATIFELAKSGGGYANTPTALAQFNAPLIPGPLVIDAHGDIFATSLAKSGPSTGTVFEIAHSASGYAGTPTTLATFGSADGTPSGALVADAAGDLFGTTNGGGANGAGEIFEIALTAGAYASSATVLANFDASYHGDGGGTLLIDGVGNLFDTRLPVGGAYGGELFELAKTDHGYASTLTALTSLDGGGASPMPGLAADSAGHLFGTASGNTPQQGSAPNSTVWEITGTGFVPTSAGGGGTGGGKTGETLTANDTAGQHLIGTPYDDTFYAGHNSVVMTGDGGADTFIFQYEPWNAGSITDFNTAADKLDLSALFSAVGYSGSNPVADGYLTFQSDGSGDTQVLFHDPANQWPTSITTLDGVSPSSITPADYGYGSSSGGGSGGSGSGGTGGSGGGTTVDDSQPTYTAPAGVTNIVLTGSAAQTVYANNQGDTITSNDHGSTIVGGTGNDTLLAGHGADMLTGGGGNDTFVFNYLPWNAGHVSDFNTATDVLNLKGIFQSIGYTGSNPVADGYLQFADDGHGDTQVYVNSHQSSDPWPTLVTTLDHVAPSAMHSGDYVFT